MRFRTNRLLAVFAVALALVLVAEVVARAATDSADLAVIVHPSAGQARLDAIELRHVFAGRTKVWPSGKPVVRFQYPPNELMRVGFDQAVLGMGPADVAKFWIDALVRGQAQAPRVVQSPGLMVKVIAAMPGAVGYVPKELVTSGVRVVALVRKGKVVEP